MRDSVGNYPVFILSWEVPLKRAGSGVGQQEMLRHVGDQRAELATTVCGHTE